MGKSMGTSSASHLRNAGSLQLKLIQRRPSTQHRMFSMSPSCKKYTWSAPSPPKAISTLQAHGTLTPEELRRASVVPMLPTSTNDTNPIIVSLRSPLAFCDRHVRLWRTTVTCAVAADKSPTADLRPSILGGGFVFFQSIDVGFLDSSLSSLPPCPPQALPQTKVLWGSGHK